MNIDIDAHKLLHDYLREQKLYLKGPERAELVFKDGCLYCFDSPFSPGGLFVSLQSFIGVCGRHIKLFVDKSSSRIFLNIQKFVELSEEPKDKKPCLKLDNEQQQIRTEYSLRIYPLFTSPLPITEGAEAGIPQICDEIIAHVSAELQQRLNSGISEWDGEERLVSKAAEDLVQLNYDGPPILYSDWECAECGLKENLWLNLTDGVIMCGRYAQLTGIKGNGHAKTHFETTGFPLVVKLGTIENGDGDIYSYTEDAPVRDPWLGQHLSHFGLDITKFRKTEKTTLEIELDANLKHEFSAIQEEGLELVSVSGPGYTGLINLGSSCYINSALQVLFIVPDFARVFTEECLFGKHPSEINEDFAAQLAKLFVALKSGDYAREDKTIGPDKERGIRPAMFRRIVGRNHPEFSTAKQQDVEEYVRYLFEKIDASSDLVYNPVEVFRFRLVTRFLDELSACVRYSFRTDIILSVSIPMDLCKETDTIVNGRRRKSVTLEQCLSVTFEEEIIDDYFSPVVNQKGRAKQQQRMGSFPDFLFLQLRRFTFDGVRGMHKLDVDVQIPDELNLDMFYSTGELQPGEQNFPENIEEMPYATNAKKQLDIEPNQDIVDGLLSMGFTENAAKKAAFFTKNESLESAINWILQHMDDTDLNDPHPMPVRQNTSPSSTQGPNACQKTRHGNGRYKLRAFISHMGSSPHSGHYVAHIMAENGQWHIFNDEKVAESQHPPKSLGYLYLFQRAT